MTEVASLQFKANIGDLKQSNAELDKLAQSAAKTEKAVDGLNEAFDGVGDSASSAAEGVRKFNNENKPQSSNGVPDAIARQRSEMEKLLDKIDPTRAALRNLTQTQKELRAGWSSGTLDTQTFLEFNRIISAQEKLVQSNARSIRTMSEAYRQGAISAGQMSAGFTNATNQLIDIGVSLQGGMSPLTVMVQQLPQLAMSFGSFSNTLSVFAGLINPVTVGVTALVAGLGYLGYEAYQSYKQTDQLNKAIATAGFTSEKSAKQLKDVAAAVKDIGDLSTSKATDLVAQVTAIGFAGDRISQVSLTVASLAKITGQSTSELVSQMNALSGDPVAAMYKLNEQYHFLNENTRQAVISLQEQGKETEAQSLILDAINNKMALYGNITPQILESNMSWWEKLTKTIAMANHETARAQALAAGVELPAIDNTQANAAALQATLDFARQNEQQTQKFNDEQIRFRKEMEASDKSMMTNAQRRAEEAEKYADAVKRGFITQQAADEHLARFNERYKDAQKKKTPATQIDAGDRITDQYRAQNLALDAQIQLLKTRGAYELNASQQRKDFILLEQKYAVLEEKAKTEALSKTEKQMLASKDQALYQASILADKGDELALLQRQAQLNDEIAKKTDTAMQAQEAQLDYAGQATRIMERKIRDAETLAKLTAQNATAEQKQAALDADRIKDQSEDLKRGDWINASKTALADWADSATNYAATAQKAITGAMDTATQSVADFALTGKLDFADFAKSILKMITEIISQLLVMQAVKGTATAMGFGNIFANANGGVYSDPSLSKYSNGVYTTPQFFQFGGRSQFANGGVFAEAGPEAIMPLTRDSNGRLGVKAEGAGGGGVNVGVTVNVQSDGSATSSVESNNAVGNALGQEMQNVAIQVIQRALKPGGLLYNRK